MPRRHAILVLSMIIMGSCTAERDATVSPWPNRDGFRFSATTTATASLSEKNQSQTAGPSTSDAVTRLKPDEEQSYELIRDFLATMLPGNPGLQKAVSDSDVTAQCMLAAGYALNQLPPLGSEVVVTTAVPPVTMISAMLYYLAEICTGVPKKDWANQ